MAGRSFQGCSEFNLLEKSDGALEKNRRVTVLLLRNSKRVLQVAVGEIDLGSKCSTAPFGYPYEIFRPLTGPVPADHTLMEQVTALHGDLRTQFI